MVGRLVSFESGCGRTLDGMMCQVRRAKGTIVHVHGSYGNFYQNIFVRKVAMVYKRHGFNFLAFNLSTHDGLAEGYGRDEDFGYVGGGVSGFESCVEDIRGAVRFAEETTERVVLQGHSLGCDRVVHYMLSTGDFRGFVLLCPCDSYELHRRWIEPETVEEQRARLSEIIDDAGESGWLPSKEYGLRQGEWTYSIPITRRALLSIIEGPPFRLFRLGGAERYYLDAVGVVYLGGADPLLTVEAEEMFAYLEERTRTVRRIYVADGDHFLSNCAEEVAKEIGEWAIGGIEAGGIPGGGT